MPGSSEAHEAPLVADSSRVTTFQIDIARLAAELETLNLKRGDVLEAGMLAFKRTDERFPPGFAPREAHRVIGRRASRPIQADETIREDMLE